MRFGSNFGRFISKSWLYTYRCNDFNASSCTSDKVKQGSYSCTDYQYGPRRQSHMQNGLIYRRWGWGILWGHSTTMPLHRPSTLVCHVFFGCTIMDLYCLSKSFYRCVHSHCFSRNRFPFQFVYRDALLFLHRYFLLHGRWHWNSTHLQLRTQCKDNPRTLVPRIHQCKNPNNNEMQSEDYGRYLDSEHHLVCCSWSSAELGVCRRKVQDDRKLKSGENDCE